MEYDDVLKLQFIFTRSTEKVGGIVFGTSLLPTVRYMQIGFNIQRSKKRYIQRELKFTVQNYHLIIIRGEGETVHTVKFYTSRFKKKTRKP